MRLTWDIFRCWVTNSTFMITHITFPSTTINVTRTTTGNESIGTGSEIFCSKDIINSTRSTCSIEVLIHDAAKKCNISGAINITATNKDIILIAKSTTISVVSYVCTLVDNDVRVVFIGLCFPVVHLCNPCQRISKVGIGIGNITVFQCI